MEVPYEKSSISDHNDRYNGGGHIDNAGFIAGGSGATDSQICLQKGFDRSSLCARVNGPAARRAAGRFEIGPGRVRGGRYPGQGHAV